MNDLSTREKILRESHKLFADRGFNGVSVREIAKICDVNIAAINYHFQNKENLYAETVIHSISNMQQDIKGIYESLADRNIVNLSIAVLEHFKSNVEDLRTSFKLVISGDDPVCQSVGSQLKKFQGPPGGEYLYHCLKEEVPTATDQDVQWAVRVIFTHIMHKAIIMCNHSICDSMSEIGLTKDILDNDLKRLVEVVKKDIS